MGCPWQLFSFSRSLLQGEIAENVTRKLSKRKGKIFKNINRKWPKKLEINLKRYSKIDQGKGKSTDSTSQKPSFKKRILCLDKCVYFSLLKTLQMNLGIWAILEQTRFFFCFQFVESSLENLAVNGFYLLY